ncbi:unnamed protein product [Heterobilharzia americana]|nr:unnamed protein product [Heterobilharzia americana]
MSGLLRFGARLLFSSRAVSKHLGLIKPEACQSRLHSSIISEVNNESYRNELSWNANNTEDLDKIIRWLQVHRLKSVLHRAKENEKKIDGFWDRILKEGDIFLTEKYLHVKVKMGIPFDYEGILRDLQDAGIIPNVRIFAALIRQSCTAGDMNQTHAILRLLREYGLKPNVYIYCQILHGYVKAGLPEEVSSTQEILSQIGLWPSKSAYEALSLYKLLSSNPDQNATCSKMLELLHVVEDPHYQLYAKDTVKVLLAMGRLAAALKIFEKLCLQTATDGYLYSLVAYADAGSLDIESLEPFWHVANLDSEQLKVIRSKCQLFLNRKSKSSNSLFSRFQRRIDDNDVEGAFDILRGISVREKTFGFVSIAEKLADMGYSLVNVLERIENPVVNESLVFGYVFNKLSSLNPKENVKSELKKCSDMVNEYRELKLLPCTDAIRFANRNVEKLLLSILSVSNLSEIMIHKKCTVMHEVFGILRYTLSRRAFQSLFTQVFEIMQITTYRYFNKVPRNIIIQLLADVCVHHKITFGRDNWLLLAMKNADVSEDVIQNLASSLTTSRNNFADVCTLFSGPPASSKSKLKENETFPLVDSINVFITEPLLKVAESLVRLQKEDPIVCDEKLADIRKSWRLERKVALLFNLANFGAEDLIERVIQTITNTNDNSKYKLLKDLAHLIRVCSESEDNKVEAPESVKEVIKSLRSRSVEELLYTLKGPHTNTLFKCWPVDHISDLIDVTNKVSECRLKSFALQLAGILINRGLNDQVACLLPNNQKIPFTFLVGSPHESLTESAFRSTMKYMEEVDPKHISGFVDYCLRNAALSNDETNLFQLIRATVSPPYNMELSEVCILPTLQVLCNRLEQCKTLPEDVLQATGSLVQVYNSSLNNKATN